MSFFRNLLKITFVFVSFFAGLYFVGRSCSEPVYAEITAGSPMQTSIETNGVVQSIASDSTYTYFAGDFTSAGKRTGPATTLSTTTGALTGSFPQIFHTSDISLVYAAASDGSGGWFVGGNFTNAGEYIRKAVVHINSDGTVDENWNANVAGAISYLRSVVVSGSYVYIGGTFSTVGGVSRSNIARVDKTTGVVDGDWNPNANGTVYSIAINGSDVYVGGSFSSIGGQTRNNIAKLNSTTGDADLSWNPNANNLVQSMTIDGTNLYVAGVFTNIASGGRAGIAKLVLATGALDGGWNASADAPSRSVTTDATYVYVGGDFWNIGGQAIRYAVRLNKTNGNADAAWVPNPSGKVNMIAIDGSAIFIAGEFTQMHAQTRNYLAKVNNTTGANDGSWNPGANGNGYVLIVSGSNILVGGNFSYTAGIARSGIVRVTNSTFELDTSWNAQIVAGDTVNSVALDGTDVYIGGYFTSAGGQARNYIAKLNSTNGNADLTWNPNSDDEVIVVKVNGSAVYASGAFSSIGGQARDYLAKLNKTNGNADAAWDSGATNLVYAIALDGSDVYVGGSFTTIGGQGRNRIAKLDSVNGDADLTWNANSTNRVWALEVHGSYVYAGGDFTTIGGQALNRVARLNKTNGNADAMWNPNIDNRVGALAFEGSNVYIGGVFQNAGGEPYNRLARADDIDGTIDSGWNPNADAHIASIAPTSYGIIVGGSFNSFGGAGSKYYYAARINPVSLYQLSNVSNTLTVLDSSGRNIKVGSFTGVDEADEKIEIYKGSLIIGTVNIDLTEDRDWSGVTADISDTEYKSYVHGLDETEGFSGSYSLTIPQNVGDGGVGICPNATSLTDVVNGCNGIYYLHADDPDVVEVAIDGTDYWRVDDLTSTGGFSMQADSENPTGSISINSGDTYVGSQNVNLSIAATDDFTGVADMMISEDAGFSGGVWETYAASKSFALSSGDGVKTVYIKIRDGWGNESSIYSDSITLDTTSPVINDVNLTDGQIISSYPYSIIVNPTDATSGISYIEIFISDTLLCTDVTADGNGMYGCNWYAYEGAYDVRLVVYDYVGNHVELTRSIVVDYPEAPIADEEETVEESTTPEENEPTPHNEESVITPVPSAGDMRENVLSVLYQNVKRSVTDWAQGTSFTRTAAPVLIAVPTTVSFFTFLPNAWLSVLNGPAFLQRLIGDLLALFGLGKKKIRWGVVFNSYNEKSINLAIVRIFSNGQLVDTAVTDSNGMFRLSPQSGTYTLQVTKPGYVFPSKLYTGVSNVGSDIYVGGSILVTAEERSIDLKVPMDPQIKDNKFVIGKKLVLGATSNLVTLTIALLVAVEIISLILLFNSPNTIDYIMAGVNTLLLAVYLFSGTLKSKSWGRVVDTRGNPVVDLELALIDSKYGKVIATQKTDEQGRYRFVVPSGKYILKPLSSRLNVGGTKDGIEITAVGKRDFLVANDLQLKR